MKSVWKIHRLNGYGSPILMPDSAEAEKYAQAATSGQQFLLDLNLDQNAAQFKLFQTLCAFVVFHSDEFLTADILKQWLKVKMGFADTYIDHTHQVGLKLKSIGPEYMDKVEFNDFFNTAFNIICSDIVPTFDQQTQTEFWSNYR